MPRFVIHYLIAHHYFSALQNSIYLRDESEISSLLRSIGKVAPYTLALPRWQLLPAMKIIEEVLAKLPEAEDHVKLIEGWQRGVGLAGLKVVAHKAISQLKMDNYTQEKAALFVTWLAGPGAIQLDSLHAMALLAEQHAPA